MAFVMDKKTKIYAGVGVVVAAAAAAWFLYLKDALDAPPPKKAPAPPVAKAPAKPEPPKPAAEPPKPVAEAPKPAAEPPKPVAEAPKEAPKPVAEPPKVEKTAAVADKPARKSRRSEDARHCLDQPNNTAIIKCAEEYL